MPAHGKDDCCAVRVARTFFKACTKLSDDDEDILPQEDAVDYKLSVFRLFAELFPEFSNKGKNGLMRLQFNKLGYEIYEKEQSRRVPAVRAKPGNPGYGFRRARWRDPIDDPQDARLCETLLLGMGVSIERIERIKKRVHDFLIEWDSVRRPSRPAGPGRPRVPKRAVVGGNDLVAGSMAAIDVQASMAHGGMMTAGPYMGSPSWGSGGVGGMNPMLARGGMFYGDRMGREPNGWEAHGDHRVGSDEPAGQRQQDQHPAPGPASIAGTHVDMHACSAMPSAYGYSYHSPVQGHAGYPQPMMGRGGSRLGMSAGTAVPGSVGGGGQDVNGKGRVGPGSEVVGGTDEEYEDMSFQENQYLRRLNKSLIAEREALNFEMEQLDLETEELVQLAERICNDANRETNPEHTVNAFRVVFQGIAGMGERNYMPPDRETWSKAMQVVKAISADYQRANQDVDPTIDDVHRELSMDQEGQAQHARAGHVVGQGMGSAQQMRAHVRMGCQAPASDGEAALRYADHGRVQGQVIHGAVHVSSFSSQDGDGAYHRSLGSSGDMGQEGMGGSINDEWHPSQQRPGWGGHNPEMGGGAMMGRVGGNSGPRSMMVGSGGDVGRMQRGQGYQETVSHAPRDEYHQYAQQSHGCGYPHMYGNRSAASRDDCAEASMQGASLHRMGSGVGVWGCGPAMSSAQMHMGGPQQGSSYLDYEYGSMHMGGGAMALRQQRQFIPHHHPYGSDMHNRSFGQIGAGGGSMAYWAGEGADGLQGMHVHPDGSDGSGVHANKRAKT